LIVVLDRSNLFVVALKGRWKGERIDDKTVGPIVALGRFKNEYHLLASGDAYF